MNYLAHAFLSFNKPDILTGNMISDFVKGRKKFQYPLAIQKGIELHRQIDHFTDFHPVTASAKEFFRPQYRLYSGAFIDIVYDHFLAIDQTQFENDGGLEKFTHDTYHLLDNKTSYFPSPFNMMYPYMREQNWLYNYRLKDGIRKSFGGLVRRAAYLEESDIAFTVFMDNYHDLQVCYDEFFPELKSYVSERLRSLLAE